MPTRHSLITHIGGAITITFALAANNAQAKDVDRAEPIETGLASWYGEEVAIGRRNGNLIYKDTASGDPFNPNLIRAAHRTLPLGTCVVVETEDDSLEVIINDRGPAEWTGNIIDITRAGAEELGFKDAGKAPVELFYC